MGRAASCWAHRAGVTLSAAVFLGSSGIVLMPSSAVADEGGVSFWVPGIYGSLAAAPAQPGWSGAATYYHPFLKATGSQTFRIGGGFQAGLKAKADLVLVNANYVFATPVFGAQAALGVSAGVGHPNVGVNATLTGPMGNTISGSRSDSVTGFSDIYPSASLKWNDGVNNFMLYTMWGAPAGTYDSHRLANTGIGHWSMDYGAGYTYLNPQTGWEASGVLGFTYNFKNPSTDYQNGIDSHFDGAISKFVSKQVHIGVVGYLYDQLTGDRGSGATQGAFKSRVAGIGPEIGYLFPIGDLQGYINLKGYGEFAAKNRPEGWNVWLTLAISPSAAHESAVSSGS